jgi:hypothetical protein
VTKQEQATINGITNTASILYRHGTRMNDAVKKALDQHGISDFEERRIILKEVCSILGTRGAKRKKALKKQSRAPRPAQQQSFRFTA